MKDKAGLIKTLISKPCDTQTSETAERQCNITNDISQQLHLCMHTILKRHVYDIMTHNSSNKNDDYPQWLTQAEETVWTMNPLSCPA